MRELTEAEAATIGGGTATESQWIAELFGHSLYKDLYAEVRAQMAKVVKELQDSVRPGS